MKTILKLSLSLTAILFLQACKEEAQQLSVGTYLACATHNSNVTCWHKDASFPADFYEKGGWHYTIGYIKKEYIDPKVAVGVDHFCVLDQEKVECFLGNDKGETDVPELISPYEIAAGEGYTCALDQTGLVCWGNELDLTDLPVELDEPFNLVAARSHICLQDNNGFYCDGFTWSGDGNPTPPSNITNPTLVTTSPDSGITCAKQHEWSCWASTHTVNDPLFFNAPDADIVVPGIQQSCSLTQGNIDCVGTGMAGPVGVEVPNIVKNATDIDIAGVHACVIAEHGISCWSGIPIVSPLNVPYYL